MRTLILIIILSCTYLSVWAQPSIKASSHPSRNPNTNVTVEFRWFDFTEITSTEYSINWDVDVIEFVDFGLIKEPSGLTRNNFDLTGVNEGYITVEWEYTGVPPTLQDGVLGYEIRFRTKSDAGGLSTLIEVTDDPLDVYITRLNSNGMNIGLGRIPGKVSVITPACRQKDSTALRQIYDNTNGSNWTNSWDVSRPIKYWEGVILDNQGCLQTIDLDGEVDGVNNSRSGNGLIGVLPEIQSSHLQKLYLSGNQLIGNVPAFDQLPQLQELTLDGNDLTLFPDLSNLFDLLELNIAGNKLSFDDVLPNIDNVPTYNYQPQQEVLQPATIGLMQGDNYAIELGIDANLTENKYEWFKDNVLYRTLTGVNKLEFVNIQRADAGVYTCAITNPNAPDLTLKSAPITIEVTCPIVEVNVEESICAGSSYQLGDQSYNTTGEYEAVLQTVSGCDSLVHLSLTVNDAVMITLNETLCNDNSYTLGDQTYTSSGNYEHTFTTATGCDSTVFLNLVIAEDRTENKNITLCSGETFRVGDDEYSENGEYTIQLQTMAGCDSTLNLFLEILPPLETLLDEQICAGTSFVLGGQSYSETGSYTADLQSVAGCDSTVFLELLVVEAIENSIDARICSGEEYRVGNEIFTEAGSYQVPLTAASGCDSIVNVQLAVAETLMTDLNETICAGESYQVGTSVYTETGIYRDDLTSTNGCDSIINLNLVVQSDAPQVVNAQICNGESYTVGTETFTTTGNYEVELTSMAGCDSLIQLNLVVSEKLETNLTEQICTGMTYVVGTETFTTTGNYTVNLLSQTGCDSLVSLDLSVVDFVEESISELICDGESISFGGEEYNATGQYQATFTTQNGCDSIVYLDLRVADEATLGMAEASDNIGTCENWTAIFAETPNGTIGEWTSLEGVPLLPTLDDLLIAEGLQRGENRFVYSLSTEDCPVFSMDTLVVNYTNPEFSVTDDDFKIEFGATNTEISLIANDSIESLDDVAVYLFTETNRLKFTETTTGVFQVVPDRTYKGVTTLTYEVCNIPCPEICRAATVTIEVLEPSADQPTLIITPNGDGLNETLVFDELDEFPSHELVITNRWGGQVFAANPYQNNWDGRNANGKPLPEGTYYYLLRLNVGEGDYQVGSVTIKR